MSARISDVGGNTSASYTTSRYLFTDRSYPFAAISSFGTQKLFSVLARPLSFDRSENRETISGISFSATGVRLSSRENPSASISYIHTESVPPYPVFVKITIAVETPAYGLNTPAGIEITASSRFLSTSSRRTALCAADDPNNTPSGTIAAHRPPTRSIRKNNTRNNNSVFFVLATLSKSGDTPSKSRLPLNGGFVRINENFPAS